MVIVQGDVVHPGTCPSGGGCCPGGSCPLNYPRIGPHPRNLSGGELSGLELEMYIPQPCAQRAHRNPPTDIYSRNVGSLYPIPIYLYYKMSAEFKNWYWIYSANIWGRYAIWRVSMRPSGEGLRNVHFKFQTRQHPPGQVPG